MVYKLIYKILLYQGHVLGITTACNVIMVANERCSSYSV